MSPANLAYLAGPISGGSGPGLFLQLIVVGTIAGILLLVWLIARASRND